MVESWQRKVFRDAARVLASNMRARGASRAHAGVWLASLAGMSLVMIATWPGGPVEPGRPMAEVACWLLYAALTISVLLASGYSSGRTASSRELSLAEWVKHTTVSPAGLVVGRLADAYLSTCVFLVCTMPFFLAASGLVGLEPSELASGLGFIVAVLAPFCAVGFAFTALIEAQESSSLALDAYLVAVLIGTAFLPGAWASLNPLIALAQVIDRSPRQPAVFGSLRLPGWALALAAYFAAATVLSIASARKLSRSREGGARDA